VHAAHVESVSLAEHVLEIYDFLGLVKGSKKRIMISAAERQLLSTDVMSSNLVMRLT
jgi:hypothetical protein